MLAGHGEGTGTPDNHITTQHDKMNSTTNTMENLTNVMPSEFCAIADKISEGVMPTAAECARLRLYMHGELRDETALKDADGNCEEECVLCMMEGENPYCQECTMDECDECGNKAVGTYGEDNTALCRECKVFHNYDDDGTKMEEA
jgi:hypothetical protein